MCSYSAVRLVLRLKLIELKGQMKQKKGKKLEKLQTL